MFWYTVNTAVGRSINQTNSWLWGEISSLWFDLAAIRLKTNDKFCFTESVNCACQLFYLAEYLFDCNFRADQRPSISDRVYRFYWGKWRGLVISRERGCDCTNLVVLDLTADDTKCGVVGMMIDVHFRDTSRGRATGKPFLLHVIIHHYAGSHGHYGMFTITT